MSDNKIYLNVGCGSHRLEGFVNIDLDSPAADRQVDVTAGLPFDAGSVAGIRCEHFIERLAHRDAFAFFREARRVLAPDGILRVATPDLARVADAYSSAVRKDWELPHDTWIRSRSEMVNVALRSSGRQWIYDEEGLVALGRSCGFSGASLCQSGESACERFRGLDVHLQSLTVEFMKEHAQVPSPSLVSILIPAYNPRFFEAALTSAIRQDYAPLEIVVSDDSPGGEIERIVARQADPRIRYERNAPPYGPSGNYVRLVELARGEYIKFLNDDDLLAPDCVPRMAGVLARMPGVSLVTSVRTPIDENGAELPQRVETRPLAADDCLIFGQHAVSLMIGSFTNFIGEPTTTMFRKRQMEKLGSALLDTFGVDVTWNVDMAMWVKLLSAGDLMYLVKPLSQFRIHDAQLQRGPAAAQRGMQALYELREICKRIGMDTAPPTQQVAWILN